MLWLIRVSSIGRAPIRRTSARSCASSRPSRPEICAPVRPSMPSGFSAKLMIGRDTISPSRTIAKLPENWSATSGGALAGGWVVAAKYASAPRSAISRVTSWKAARPSSVNSKVTFGWLVVWSKPCSGLVMSSPESAGRSRRTKYWEVPVWLSSSSVSGLSGGSSSTTTVPCGTSRISEFGGCSSVELDEEVLLVAPRAPRAAGGCRSRTGSRSARRSCRRPGSTPGFCFDAASTA